MRLTTPVFMLAILAFSFSCEQETPTPIEASQFPGEYTMAVTHISWVHTFYDSIGNITGQGYDTTNVSGGMLTITESTNDTFLLANLVSSLRQTGSNVTTMLLDDTLRIQHEYGEPQLRNDYIRGDIWLEEDSLFYKYTWDHSDIWSTGALPERGIVSGRGIRK